MEVESSLNPYLHLLDLSLQYFPFQFFSAIIVIPISDWGNSLDWVQVYIWWALAEILFGQIKDNSPGADDLLLRGSSLHKVILNTDDIKYGGQGQLQYQDYI
ncbi:hypothetical protein GIB67_005628 [Kingdonia uniflora]|uniref:Uncharacterized protein n=1 Tax=Kingdonia uniflora TaxID=39325 RepID=A0A7J7NIF2_9MAGN|nr:hypothetical protein GIB67_005628 [Kingdonia uniflora]